METFMISLFYTTLLFGLLVCFKANNTLKNHNKICGAIDRYVDETKDYNKGLILLHNMESFDNTLFRFTDWGCKRILPKAYFELIKPYIQ